MSTTASEVERAPAGRVRADRRRVVADVLPWWVAMHLLLGAAGLLAATTVGSGGDLGDRWLSAWGRWDVLWNVEIAETGWSGSTAERPAEWRPAFFPLLPLLMRGLAPVVGGPVAAGLLVSAVATAAAALALHRLVDDAAGIRAARVAVALLLFSPFSVFLFAGYTEPLLLGLALPCWYAARRGSWWVAGVLASGAALTRVTGLLLAVALVVELLRRERGLPQLVRHGPPLLLPFAAWLGWTAWLASTTGRWDAYTHAQELGWGRGITDPVSTLLRSVELMSGQWDPYFTIIWLLEIGCALGGVVLAVVLWRRSEPGLAVLVGLHAVLLSTASYHQSGLRAALTWFPLLLLAAPPLAARPVLCRGVLAACVTVSALGAVLFTHGMWVG